MAWPDNECGPDPEPIDLDAFEAWRRRLRAWSIDDAALVAEIRALRLRDEKLTAALAGLVDEIDANREMESAGRRIARSAAMAAARVALGSVQEETQ